MSSNRPKGRPEVGVAISEQSGIPEHIRELCRYLVGLRYSHGYQSQRAAMRQMTSLGIRDFTNLDFIAYEKGMETRHSKGPVALQPKFEKLKTLALFYHVELLDLLVRARLWPENETVLPNPLKALMGEWLNGVMSDERSSAQIQAEDAAFRARLVVNEMIRRNIDKGWIAEEIGLDEEGLANALGWEQFPPSSIESLAKLTGIPLDWFEAPQKVAEDHLRTRLRQEAERRGISLEELLTRLAENNEGAGES